MLNHHRVAVVLPAYNAGVTLHRTVRELDRAVVDDIILTDDCSRDDTVAQARALGLHVITHATNRGYGGNQKSCYHAALERGADIVVMLHPDYQYTPALVTALTAMIAYGTYDVALASRILGAGALQGGMPRYKYLANRGLTLIENVLLGLKLSEYHTGYRAFGRRVLETLPFDANSEDFVFDNQMLAQAAAAGFRLGELSCPTRYAADSSSISFRRSVTYGLGVLRTGGQYRAHRWGLLQPAFLHALAGRAAPEHSGPSASASSPSR